jgi:hypothetical protein
MIRLKISQEMSPKLSCRASVSIEGTRVLQFLGMRPDYAKYSLLGFRRTLIFVCDYRFERLQAIEHVLKTYNVSSFAKQFNRPAFLEIVHCGEAQIRVNLREIDDSPVDSALWIAVGMQPRIPTYDYKLCKLEPYGKNLCSVFSVIQI